jgi:hypothetical protein
VADGVLVALVIGSTLALQARTSVNAAGLGKAAARAAALHVGRRGIGAELVLVLAAAREPLPARRCPAGYSANAFTRETAATTTTAERMIWKKARIHSITCWLTAIPVAHHVVKCSQLLPVRL